LGKRGQTQDKKNRNSFNYDFVHGSTNVKVNEFV
jgi:hypothetical protein